MALSDCPCGYCGNGCIVDEVNKSLNEHFLNQIHEENYNKKEGIDISDSFYAPGTWSERQWPESNYI